MIFRKQEVLFTHLKALTSLKKMRCLLNVFYKWILGRDDEAPPLSPSDIVQLGLDFKLNTKIGLDTTHPPTTHPPTNHKLLDHFQAY